MKSRLLFTIIAVMAISSVTLAADRVTIESKTVDMGATGVQIGVFLENDQDLKSIGIPLILRELNPGAFITSMTLDYSVSGSRLTDAMLTEVKIRNHYAEEDGNCKSNQPGGLGTIAHSDGGPHPVVSSPEGTKLGRQKIFSPPLPAGVDVIPSMMVTVDVASVVGSFEIDTTCCDPA